MTRRVAVRAALLVGLVAAVATGASAEPRDPWAFQDADAAATAEREYPRTWYDAYQEAVELIDDGADLEGAIGRLRLAVRRNPSSSASEYHPRRRRSFAYVPYYHLALAFERAGAVDEALACVARERAGDGADAALRSTLDGLEARLRSAGRRAGLLRVAERATARAALVDVAGATAAREASRAAAALRDAAGATDAAAIAAATDAAAAALAGMLDSAAGAARTRLRGLAADAWAPAFADRAGALAVAGCDAPANDASIAVLDEALDRVERCAARALDAVRHAGEWGCARVRARRTELARINEAWREWAPRHGESPATPAVPPQPTACEVDWTRSGWDEAAAALDAIDFVALDGRLRTDVAGRQARMRQAPRRETPVEAAAAPPAAGATLPASCDALLDGARAALPAPPANGGAWDGATVRSILPGIERSSARIADGRDACPGVDARPLDAFAGALSEFRLTGRAADLGRACELAVTARAELRRCWERNADRVGERVDAARFVVEAAATLAPAGDPGTACLAAAARDLPRRVRRGADGAQVADALRGIEAAETCVDRVLAATTAGFERRVERVTRIGARLADGATRLDGPAATRVGSIGAAVAGWLERADAVRDGLAAGGAPTDRGALLTDDAAPSDWRRRLAGLPPASGDATTLRRLIVARVATARAAAIEDRIPTWAALADALDAREAAHAALTALRAGDLDAAVLGLRRARAAGRLPHAGRPGAVSHATLAYTLFLKSRALGDGPPGRDVAEDAAAEACAAERADPSFAPEAALFPHPAFSALFDGCAYDATRRR